MDGGVANTSPVSHAIELGAQEIYVLPTGNACALDQPPRSALAMALHAVSLLTQRRLIDDIERYRADAPPCPLAIPPIDFDHADTLIQGGYSGAQAFLDSGGTERPPIRMRMHRHTTTARNPNDPVAVR